MVSKSQSKTQSIEIPDPDDPAWLASAQLITDFVCDAGFDVTGRLTTWRETGADGQSEQVFLAAVPLPRLPQRLPNVFVTADIVGHTTELITYYQALIAAATEVGLKDQLLDPFPHFRIKPVIATDTALAGFPWYDTVTESKMVLRAIGAFRRDTSQPQLIHDDLDQGWRVRIAAWRGRIGLVEWDWEETEAPATTGVSFDAAELVRQADAALKRLGVIHRDLVQAFGQDFWNFKPRT
jgi:hypothetical protein